MINYIVHKSHKIHNISHFIYFLSQSIICFSQHIQKILHFILVKSVKIQAPCSGTYILGLLLLNVWEFQWAPFVQTPMLMALVIAD